MSATLDRESCWLWGGSYYSSGYGQAWSRQLRRSTQAHRLVYETLRGAIPVGLTIDHLCRVRGCVNPDHLRVVPIRENIHAPGATCLAKLNAEKDHCPQGHSYTPENTYVCARGKRYCRQCKIEWKRAARARARAVSSPTTIRT